MSILNRLFSLKAQRVGRRPFDLNVSREERIEWFAHTAPWDQVDSSVVDAILDGFTNRSLLEEFVLISMKSGLVPEYAFLGRGESDATAIRAQVSQLLCGIGNRAVADFEKAMKARNKCKIEENAMLALCTLQSATALVENQVAAYAGLAALYGMIGQSAKSHDYANRGLQALEELRRVAAASAADVLEQVEQRLRNYIRVS